MDKKGFMPFVLTTVATGTLFFGILKGIVPRDPYWIVLAILTCILLYWRNKFL